MGRNGKCYEDVTRKFLNSNRISHEYIIGIFITGEGNANGRRLSAAPPHHPPPKKKLGRNENPDKAEAKKEMYETPILKVVFLIVFLHPEYNIV